MYLRTGRRSIHTLGRAQARSFAGGNRLLRNMLDYFWTLLVGPTRRAERRVPASPPVQHYRTAVLPTRDAAMTAAARGSVLAIAEASGRRKWALLQCPCGCREILAVNLMRTHRPFWTVSIDAQGNASVYPSIDSTTCGAHFWLRNGIIIWALGPDHS